MAEPNGDDFPVAAFCGNQDMDQVGFHPDALAMPREHSTFNSQWRKAEERGNEGCPKNTPWPGKIFPFKMKQLMKTMWTCVP